MSSSTTNQQALASYLVGENAQAYYGIPNLTILASSHPNSPACIYTTNAVDPNDVPPKQVLRLPTPMLRGFPTPSIITTTTHAFENHVRKVYNDDTAEKILVAITSVLKGTAKGWTVGFYRMGFEAKREDNPVTFQVVLPRAEGMVLEEVLEIAKGIISAMRKLVVEELGGGEWEEDAKE
ncbi:hypothetical protein G7Y89_g593 [Cudoniella acicularis]|uniref:Uncharacterized protein n=1 Tax=Cudoniella acicularis TaxID=354080 RepID=A0A8H4RWV8_9HELO|nr:hypothetical protein G7Y89_g593 [Cudoniella acicularis]